MKQAADERTWLRRRDCIRDVAEEHDELPPLHFGDYPNGAYWSAAPSDGASAASSGEEEPARYEGRSLRIMWDEEAGPLWGDGGLLPDGPEWMQLALGLSDALISDLLAWMADMTALHRGPAADDWEEQDHTLEARGDDLAERLQRQVGRRCAVWHQA